MNRLADLALGGFALAVVVHLTGSMGFDALGYGFCALILLRLLLPIRPAPPTPGLGFILLAGGGLAGWFTIEEFAVPGSWPMIFKAFAGICLGGLIVFVWQFFARQQERSSQPLQPTTQNMLVTGLLLLLLTPLARQANGFTGVSEVDQQALLVQQGGVLLAVIGFSLARQQSDRWRWLVLLLPPILAVPIMAKLMLMLQRPLMMAMWLMAPNLGGGNVGFTPLQYLDHQAFLKPSSKVVMRVRAQQLPSPYLVGNRLTRFSSASMSWGAGPTTAEAVSIPSSDTGTAAFQLLANDNGDQAPSQWSMAVTSLRWDDLLFLPPQAGVVSFDGDSFELNAHQVWSGAFTEGAAKFWRVRPGTRKAGVADPETLQLPEFWDQPLQQRAAQYALIESGGRTQQSTRFESERRRVVARIREDFLGREYSLSVDLNQRKPFHDFFLNDRPGYCFWFATAAGLALRANQIPSRLVSGYYVHERVGGDLWLVRERDAHSWIEWQDEQGYWHTFDPTPPSLGLFQQQYQGSVLGRWVHLIRDRISRAWASFDLTEQTENIAIIGGFAILLFLFVREYLRIREVNAKLPHDQRARQWRKLWQQFIALSGLPDQQHWSAEDYRHRLPADWSGSQVASAEAFLSFYQQSRFAADQVDLSQGKTLLSSLRRAMKERP